MHERREASKREAEIAETAQREKAAALADAERDFRERLERARAESAKEADQLLRAGLVTEERLKEAEEAQVLFLDGEHLAPGALGIKERKVFESPPEPRARMAVIRDSLSPVDATSAFASAAATRASRRSGGRREPNTPLSRGMSEPERGV